MNYKQKYRLRLILIFILGFTVAAALILYAFKNSIDLYYIPSQLPAKAKLLNKSIRLGGLVEQGSIVRQKGLKLNFNVTDKTRSIKVVYEGILPDLFKEGQGVVVMGKFKNSDEFIAKQVLAKHDEKYKPPGI